MVQDMTEPSPTRTATRWWRDAVIYQVYVRSFADGSMHPTFASAVSTYNVDEDGVLRTRVATSAGTIPANIRTPPTGERASRAPPERQQSA